MPTVLLSQPILSRLTLLDCDLAGCREKAGLRTAPDLSPTLTGMSGFLKLYNLKLYKQSLVKKYSGWLSVARQLL
jgi:hypothetical protein